MVKFQDSQACLEVVAGLVSRLVGLIWALIRGIFDLICWIFGYRKKNVLVESPKKVRFEGI
jgi:hypothetical protein